MTHMSRNSMSIKETIKFFMLVPLEVDNSKHGGLNQDPSQFILEAIYTNCIGHTSKIEVHLYVLLLFEHM